MLQRIFYTALALFIATIAFAQQKKNDHDTTEITVKVVTKSNDSIIVDTKGQKWVKTVSKPRNVTTSWWGFDLGFSNYVDNTDYSSAGAQAYAPGSNSSWFDLKNGKSMNVNIWFFNQKINLIKQVVHLKYALGLELNNYRYKSAIRYHKNPAPVANSPIVHMDNTVGRVYSKNKLAADYITLPLMLNFNFAPYKTFENGVSAGNFKYTKMKTYGYGFSAGVSVGYLYAARNKFVTSDEGKHKIKDDFDLRPWKISYVGELNMGYVSIYGSYAIKSMYKRGLDMTPFNIGLRLGL